MGLYGYVKAKSVPSVVAGEVGFGLCALSAGLMWAGKPAGLWLGIATAGLLALVFLIRLLKSRKFMPPGLMLLFSLGALAALLAKA
jgi:uncharacterized membrane protein (UPF0136 family)